PTTSRPMTTRRVCARPTGRTTSGSSSSSAATTRITSSTSTRTSPRTDLGTDVLIYVDTSDVRDGALAELKWAIEELAAYVGNAQRRMLAYSAFLLRRPAAHDRRTRASRRGLRPPAPWRASPASVRAH